MNNLSKILMSLFFTFFLISCEGRKELKSEDNSTQSDQTIIENKPTLVEDNDSKQVEDNTTLEYVSTTPNIDSSTQNSATSKGFGALATPQELLDGISFAVAPLNSTLSFSMDLSFLMPPVGNQGTQNSCVGWAVGYYLKSFQEHVEHGTTYGVGANYTNRYSPAFIYNLTKAGGCEAGANLYDALKLLQTTGVSLWNDMPYNQNHCDSAPSHQAMIKAKCAKISEFKRFDIYSRDLIYNMRYFLAQSYPIVTTIMPYADFIEPKLDNGEYFYGEFDENELPPIFSHAIVVVGYDDTREAFKIINSWGTQWGNDGYLWIDYEVFQKIVIEAFMVEDYKGECNLSQEELKEISQDIDSSIRHDESLLTGSITKEKPVELNISDDTSGAVGVQLIDREWVANSVTFKFKFSRAVEGFESEDIHITNAIKFNFRGEGDTYYIDATPPIHSTDAITLSVASKSAHDSDGNGNVVATATQEVNTVKAFITTWDTTKEGISGRNQLKFGANGSEYNYLYDIDWGDGTKSERLTQSNVPKHTYTQEGNYTVSITGEFPLISLVHDTYVEVDNLKLISIEQWGTQPWRSMSAAFYKCENVIDNTIDNPNLSNVESLGGMFYGAKKFDGNLSSWDVSNITSISNMFDGATSFNGDLSDWNVSNVKKMDYMFHDAKVFNHDLDTWDVSKVESMQGMFYGARDFNGSIANWDVANVTNMNAMFREASNFTSDLSNWNVSSVEDMSHMFFRAKNFNSDLSNWDVSRVKNMSYMFRETKLFNSDLSRWGVSSVTDMSHMFHEAKSFNSDLSRWDVSSVTDMDYMFNDAVDFTSDLSAWDVSNVVTMRYLFAGLPNFTSDLSRWDVSSVEVMQAMFKNAHSFRSDLSRWDVSNVQLMHNMFENAQSFDGDLSSWNISEVSNMSDMFVGSNLSSQNYSKMLDRWSGLVVNDHVTWGVGNTQYSPDVAYKRQYLTDILNWTIYDGGMIDLPQTNNQVPTIVSLVNITPSQGYIEDTFSFEVALSNPLPSNDYSIYLNFDNLAGGWLDKDSSMGHLRMNCSGTICGLFLSVDREGNRSVRAGVFNKDTLIGQYSNLSDFNVIKKANTKPPTGGITGFFDNMRVGNIIYTKFHGYAYGDDNISTLTLHVVKSDTNATVVNQVWHENNDYNYHGEYSIDTSNWEIGEYQYFFVLQDSSRNITTYNRSFIMHDGEVAALRTTVERVKGASSLVQGQKDIALKLYGIHLDQVLKISIPGVGEISYHDTNNFYRESDYLSFYIPEVIGSSGLPAGDIPITLYTNNATVIESGLIYVEAIINETNTNTENNESNTTGNDNNSTETGETNTTNSESNSTTGDNNSSENNETNTTVPDEINTTLCDFNLTDFNDTNHTTYFDIENAVTGIHDLYMGEYLKIELNIPQYDTPRDIEFHVMDNCSGEIKTLELYESVNNLYATWRAYIYIHAKDSYNYSAGNYTATLKVSDSSDSNRYDIIHQQFSIFSESINPIPIMGELEFFNCGVKASEYNATDNISLAYTTLNLLDKTTNEIKEIRKWNYLDTTQWSYTGTGVSCSDLIVGREYDLILTVVDASGNETNDTKTFIAPESMFKPVVYLDSLSATIPYGTTQESVILQAYDTNLESITLSVTQEGSGELLMHEEWLGSSFNKRYYIQTQNYTVGRYIATLIAKDQAGYTTELNQTFEVIPIELDPPEYIRASRTYTDRVETSWKAIDGATQYYIYRCKTTDTVPDDNNFTLLAITDDANYTDSSVDVHYRYFYKVKSYNASSGLSNYSDYNKGYIILKAPTNVQAIDNIANDRVRIVWDSVENANLYYIFRASSIDGSYSNIAHTSNLYYDDTSIDNGTIYYYKVWAEIDTISRAVSNYSEPTTGYTQITTPTIVLGSVNPSSGYELDEFTFTATLSSPLPSGYQLYLNFDNREGGWLSSSDESGYVQMSCSTQTCSLTMPVKFAGTRQIRAVLFSNGVIQSTTYSFAQSFVVNPLTYYQLQNKNSSKCLDSYWGGTTDGTDIIQYTCTNADSLQWSLKDIGDSDYFIVNNKSKKCIKVPNSSMDDGAILELGECSYSDKSTKWQREGNLLRNSMSDKCMDVQNTLKDDFVNIIQNTCVSRSTSMQWSLY